MHSNRECDFFLRCSGPTHWNMLVKIVVCLFTISNAFKSVPLQTDPKQSHLHRWNLILRGGTKNIDSRAAFPGDRSHEIKGESDEEDSSLGCLSSFALDSVKIRVGLDGEWFAPLFAHQIFGKNEEIVGYDSPEVRISYSAGNLIPCIEFEHRGMILSPENRSAGLKQTDVLATISERAPAEYVAPEIWKAIACESGYHPPGRIVDDYNAHSMPPMSSKRKRVANVDEGKLVRYEIYHCSAGEGDEAAARLLKCVQSLAVWLIERASYIDLRDGNWSCLLLYERSAPTADTDAGPRYRFMGFASLYRAAMDSADPGLRELTPMHRELARLPSLARLRVAQLAVLPPDARRGHGTMLLRAVYALARRDPAVLDVDVEEPGAAFAAMRERCELALLREAGLLPDLPWAASDAIRDGSAPTPTTPTWRARYDADLPAFLRWYLPGTGPAAVSRRRGRPDRLRRTQVTAGPLKGGRGGNQFLAYSKALRSQS